MSDQGGEEWAALNVREFSIKRMEDMPECQTVQNQQSYKRLCCKT
jgi:hypothetical protein